MKKRAKVKKRANVMRRNWSDVPQDILGFIAERLSIDDYVRYGAVCKSWLSAIVNQRGFNFSPKTLPWLVFPRGNDTDVHDFSNNKVHRLNLEGVSSFCCFGSPGSWLVLFHNEKLEILNPLSRVRYSLPPFSRFDDYDRRLSHGFHKVVLATSSTTRANNQFVVFIVFNLDGKLAFARPRNRYWTTINIEHSWIDDIVHFNNQFYMVDTECVVWRFNITRPTPIGTQFVLPPPHDVDVDVEYMDHTFYLVELMGEMHMVVKYSSYECLSMEHHFEPDSRPFEDDFMYYFRAFKMDFHTQELKEVVTLGDYVIFVGHNTSFSLLASDYPQCKPSCIYFTDHRMLDLSSTGNIGIFNLVTEGLETLYTGDDDESLCSLPVWFTPSLC